jgi:hypothetical protein
LLLLKQVLTMMPAWSPMGNGLLMSAFHEQHHSVCSGQEEIRGVYDCMTLQLEPQKNYGASPGRGSVLLPIFLRKKIYNLDNR